MTGTAGFDQLREQLVRGANDVAGRQRRIRRLGAAAVIVVLGGAGLLVVGSIGDDDLGDVAVEAGPGPTSPLEIPERFELIAPYPDDLITNAVATLDDHIFAWGTLTAARGPSATAEGYLYDRAASTWSRLPPSPIDPTSDAIAVPIDGGVIVCCSTGTALYDLAANDWRRLADGPFLDRARLGWAWTGEELLVMTGSTFAAYHADDDTWTTLASPPDDLLNFSSADDLAWTGSGLYVFPPRNPNRPIRPALFYDRASDTWSTVTVPLSVELPNVPRLAWADERLAVIGAIGQTDILGGVIYEPATETWTTVSQPYPEPRGSVGNSTSISLATDGHQVVVHAGGLSSGVDEASIRLLTLDLDTGELTEVAAPGLAYGDLRTSGSDLVVVGPDNQIWLPADPVADPDPDPAVANDVACPAAEFSPPEQVWRIEVPGVDLEFQAYFRDGQVGIQPWVGRSVDGRYLPPVVVPGLEPPEHPTFGRSLDFVIHRVDRTVGGGYRLDLALVADPEQIVVLTFENCVLTAETAAAVGSQTPADAARDGVVPGVAALAFDQRVNEIAGLDSPEGRWALSQPLVDGIDLVLGDASGIYGADWIHLDAYGEILLLSPDNGEILRAYPMPGVPPDWIHIEPDALYGGRLGDWALPDSTVFRIDRASADITKWVMRAPSGEGVALPSGWIEAEGLDAARLLSSLDRSGADIDLIGLLLTEACPGDSVVSSPFDVDGDGRSDTATIATADDTKTLTVCTASGERATLDVHLEAYPRTADVDGDGRTELLVVGTTASSALIEVVQYRDQRLQKVDGLTFTTGFNQIFGCDDIDGDGTIDLFAGTYETGESGIRWQRTIIRLSDGGWTESPGDEGVIAPGSDRDYWLIPGVDGCALPPWDPTGPPTDPTVITDFSNLVARYPASRSSYDLVVAALTFLQAGEVARAGGIVKVSQEPASPDEQPFAVIVDFTTSDGSTSHWRLSFSPDGRLVTVQ